MRKILFLLVLALAFSGCVTLNTVKQSKGKGVTRIYDYSYDQVYNAMLTSVSQQNLKIAEQNKEQGYLYTSHGVSFWSAGERIAVFVTKVNDNQTSVEISDMEVGALLDSAPNWTNDIFSGIDRVLHK